MSREPSEGVVFKSCLLLGTEAFLSQQEPVTVVSLQGPFDNESCPCRHSINPYGNRESRILFSTWNLDHVYVWHPASFTGIQLEPLILAVILVARNCGTGKQSHLFVKKNLLLGQFWKGLNKLIFPPFFPPPHSCSQRFTPFWNILSPH